MDAPPLAPPVVAVIVTCDPDEWFEETLAAFGAQDYPNLSILILDAGRREEATARVAGVLPSAYVRRLASGTEFGEAANHVFQLVQDAAYLVFCHDDAAPEPDALRVLVEEALRSNAGIVGPKVVDWFDPERLLSVGLAADKTAQAAPLVERHELDQEQYDAVRDVFAVASVCTLVRSDLFTMLQGYDAAMGGQGEDVDLCWRAQIAGARVLVAPNARVRHLEDGLERKLGPGPDSTAQLRVAAQHRLRAVLKNYGPFHLLRVLPQAAFLSLAEAIVAILGGRWTRAKAVASAWSWNLGRVGDLRRERQHVRRARTIPDSEVRRLQMRGSARVSMYVRTQVATGERINPLVSTARNVRASLRTRAGVAATLAVLAGAAVLLVGSRGLLSGRIAAVGQLANFPRAGDFLREYVDGWRSSGLGSVGPAPPAFLFFGLVGVILLGSTSALRRGLIVGAWPSALVGAWRLTRRLGSTRARLVTLAIVAAIPLPYDALAQGRWTGLVAYGAFPWLLAPLLASTGAPPFARGQPATSSTVVRQILVLGIGLALTAALAPAVAFAVAVVAVCLAIGVVLSERDGSATRPLVVGAGGVALAAVLLFPWSLRLLTSGEWSAVGGVATASERAFPLGQLLRFQTGPLGAPPIGWVFLAAAALPLLIGRGWRLAWAIRMWVVAVGCVLVAWASGLGWLPTALRAPEVLLAPAAIALAVATGLGVVAFETDLPGYRFGWRQLASVVAASAAVLGGLQVLGAAVDGRWNLPTNDPVRALAWMRSDAGAGAFRVLWIGDSDVLPLDGWKLGGSGDVAELAYATSRNGPPSAIDSWPGPSGGTDRIRLAVDAARRGDTTRLGHLLAPMAVRYIVLCQAAVPGNNGSEIVPVPPVLTQALESQTDLRQLPSDRRLVVYESTAWGPGRSELPTSAGEIPTGAQRRGVDLSDAKAVLPGRGPVSFRGSVAGDSSVFVSESSSPSWQLTVGGARAARSRAFGWANAYAVDSGGHARLRFRTPVVHYGALLLQLLLWVWVIRQMLRIRRRRSHLSVTPPLEPEGDEP